LSEKLCAPVVWIVGWKRRDPNALNPLMLKVGSPPLPETCGIH